MLRRLWPVGRRVEPNSALRRRAPAPIDVVDRALSRVCGTESSAVTLNTSIH
jgi:hypothetical protein